MHLSIRAFSGTDLKTADAILRAAFQRPDSWLRELRMIRKLQPAGAFLAYQRDIPVGVVVSLMYPDFTYIGPLGVRPDFQRLGIGFALMERLLAWLDQQGVTRVALDASPMGQSMYERLGFVACDLVDIFQRQSGGLAFQPPSGVQHLSLQNLDLITAIDKQAFGTDRSRLLQTLLDEYPQRGFLLKDGHGNARGYLIAQEKYIGPWISQKAADAELLLKAALSLSFSTEPVTVVAPVENSEATVLLHRFGFEKVRVLRHMVRGSNTPAGQRTNVYGQASPSLG
jgi:ribosomal protein S18 acetylase RimI-like enzyme